MASRDSDAAVAPQLRDGRASPAGAQNALQALVSRLRRHLPDGAVESHPAGYRLAVAPDAVDVHRFERLAAAGSAAAAGDPHSAAGLLDEALALRRGPALAEVADAGTAPRARLRRRTGDRPGAGRPRGSGRAGR